MKIYVILLIIISLFFLQACSKEKKEPLIINENTLTNIFYKTGDIVIYDSIDSEYKYEWTGNNRGLIPKNSYRALDMKIANIHDNIWVKGTILMDKGNYINYLTGASSGYFADMSAFGYFMGKPFICSQSKRKCSIPNDDYLKALVFKPWFEKKLYTIIKEEVVGKFICYTYKNHFLDISNVCIDSKGFIISYEDTDKKVIINSYIMGENYGASISNN